MLSGYPSRFTLVLPPGDSLLIINRQVGHRRPLPTLLDRLEYPTVSLRSPERMELSFPQVQVNNHLVPSARPVIVINRNLFRIPQPRGAAEGSSREFVNFLGNLLVIWQLRRGEQVNKFSPITNCLKKELFSRRFRR